MLSYNLTYESSRLVEFCSCLGYDIWIEEHTPVVVQPSLLTDVEVNKILEDYCICEGTTNEINLSSACPKISDLAKCKRTKKRLLIQTFDIVKLTQKLLYELELILNEEGYIVVGKRKSFRSEAQSNRRSNYIGVFKNGPHWQALICIRKRKTYIGTFTSETQAAKVFDLHSLLLHGLTAKTNFSYTKEGIINLVEEFKDLVQPTKD